MIGHETIATTVRVLEEDRDLAASVSADRRLLAERACVASALVLQRGRWSAGANLQEASSGFGLLILRGLLSGRVGLRSGYGAELLGPGDVLRPLPRPYPRVASPFDSSWTVIRTARLAILGPRFVSRAAAFPELGGELVGRALERARRLAVNMAIVHNPRVEERVHLLLWHLALRWGQLTSEGTALSLPLTHALLAEMIASRRPTVTKALTQLAQQGRVRPTDDGWLLTGTVPTGLETLTALGGSLAADELLGKRGDKIAIDRPARPVPWAYAHQLTPSN
jgi:CRP/FNR family transcriptional regulator, cyclic AMP receptor protein